MATKNPVSEFEKLYGKKAVLKADRIVKKLQEQGILTGRSKDEDEIK